MQLSVIGSAGSYPGPKVVCSSYLVHSEETSILLDLGNGALSRLYGHIDPTELNAIIISHGHLDHYADIVGLFHLLKYGSTLRRPIPLFATNDVMEKLEYLLGSDLKKEDIFVLNPTTGGQIIKVDKMTVQFFNGNHPVPTLITRISDHGATMCYGADGDFCSDLLQAAKDVDLLLAESTWVEMKPEYLSGLHLDSRAVGKLAETAGAKYLVVTHVAYPGDKNRVLEIVKENFKGVAQLAQDGASFLF